MYAIEERCGSDLEARKLLIAVDNTLNSEKAVSWVLDEFYREGDEIHIVHVIPLKHVIASAGGAPPIDSLPQQGPSERDELHEAQLFIQERLLTKLQAINDHVAVHILKGSQDSDSVGNSICSKANELPAALIVMASQGKSKLQQFFLGSTSDWVSKSSKIPVLIVHKQ